MFNWSDMFVDKNNLLSQFTILKLTYNLCYDNKHKKFKVFLLQYLV